MASGSEREDGFDHHQASPSPSPSPRDKIFEYSGWVYHLGTNSIGHEYCHLRYLLLRGKNVYMYKRDPHDDRNHKPIRKGIVGPSLMIEELGRKRVNHGDVYVVRFYNQLDQRKKGEIACATAGEARKWMDAFEYAKQQAEFDLVSGSGRDLLNCDNVINLEGHRPRVRRYAEKLIKIGKGPEPLLRQSSNLGTDYGSVKFFEGDVDDAIVGHEWKCIRIVNGIRIFEDIANSKMGKSILLKSVGVVDASMDTVFEVVYSIERKQRYEWDAVSDCLEIVETLNGHCDVVYGTYDPHHLVGVDCRKWNTKRDFLFSRQWFRGQDKEYTILQIPAVHKKHPPRSGYHRISVDSSYWEIRKLKTSTDSSKPKCIVTQIMEIHLSRWRKSRKHYFRNFERTIQYALLCQVAGLREYCKVNPSLKHDSTTSVQMKSPRVSDISVETINGEDNEQFYDAIAADGSVEEEDSDEEVDLNKGGKLKLRNVAWAIASLSLKRKSALDADSQLDFTSSPVSIDRGLFNGSLPQGKGSTDSDCWMQAAGQSFMIRGKSYLQDSSKVIAGDPLLKLLAVDWFKSENTIGNIALHPKCLVQTEAAKGLPFILVVNLEVPARPNYSLVLYYAADRPITIGSLLQNFVDGTDAFRNSRFKLIPCIVEGYWMVKRAVGTKPCLLGRAVSCKYLRQDNFLEIDVDIGSSSVARGIIGLVLGYVTSLVVDLAILIEAKEEKELPEYLLGSVRLNKVKLDSAAPFSEY